MKAYKTFRFRIYPNAEQKARFKVNFECVRFIYNKMLEDMIAYHNKSRKTLQCKVTYYNKRYPHLREADSRALNNARKDLEKNWNDILAKSNKKYPKFITGKSHRNCYKTNFCNSHNRPNIVLANGRIRLPKIGYVRIKQHQDIPERYYLKEVMVSQTPSGKYYVNMIYEYENSVPYKEPHSIIGLDHSMMELYVDSNGNTPGFVHYCYQLSEKIKCEKRKLSKMQEGSKNYEKQWIKISKLYEKASNRRNDSLHQISKKLTNSYDAVCIENLDIQSILKDNGSLGKLIMDNGWKMFTELLKYKLEKQGKQLITVDRYFPSSQICSCCGVQNHNLRNYHFSNDPYIKEWDCPYCGTHHDRDVNAAVNIRNEGIRMLSL